MTAPGLWMLAMLAGAAVTVAMPAPYPAGRQAQPQPAQPYSCTTCHPDMRRAFVQGVHSEQGIRCHDCHGGNPAAFERPAAHRGGFVGAPDKIETIRVCASCHADPNQMRQYGLPADQLAEFRTSRHGQLLLVQRDLNAPTCTDCHGAHRIPRPQDARSTIHPANIPATCGRCHQDERLMAQYGLPTDQVRRYEQGAHGRAVLEERNFASPTCVGCHGSHAALPPRVTEITHVCERCHVILGRAFNDGPHAQPAMDGRIPGCTGCHSNHGTDRAAPTQIAALCAGCHAEASPAAVTGVELQERVVRATEDLNAATEAIDALVLAGRRVTDARFRYQGAVTAYNQIALVQHSLDLDALEDLTLRVRSISQELRSTAEVAEEQRWEHKLFLIPVWFLALAGIAFAGFKYWALQHRAR